MTITEMQERKKELGYTYKQIAELSGVPVGTVQKVLGGNTESPRYDTLMALEKVLKKNGPFMVCELGFEYLTGRQGEYTVEDYYQMPNDQRVELIDSWIYDMSAPTSIHQILTGNIFAALLTFVMAKGDECLPLVSPVDYTIYGFDSVIPVAIWDGRCQIDFSKLYDQIRFIYEREE